MITKRKNFKRDDSPENKFLPFILAILLLGIIGFLFISNYRISMKRAEMQSQIDGLQTEIKALEDKKQQLEAGISAGQSQDFLEKEARDKLGLKKPGEDVVVVTPVKESQGTSTQQNKTFWQKIIQAIGF